MSWKKQGGTNRLDATSNVNVNSVVANKFTIKDYFYGDMNVLGNINADGSMKVKGNLLAGYVGAENIFANLTLKVLRNATIYGSMAVKNDMYVYERQILGNIERNDNIVTIFTNDSITGNLGITQAKILDARTGEAVLYFDGHIGFGTNDPVATLDITGNIPLTFAVRTDDVNNYSIISRNNEDTGVVAHTDLATTEIQFYKETPIPADISDAVPDARIQYIEGGVLAIEAGNSVITYSKSVLTTRDADQIVNNSALTIYDIDNGLFAFDAYNNPNSIKSNAISISGPDAESMSMIHFTNSETNSGISIGGGAYPAQDPLNNLQRMGTIGYTQSNGTYAPIINIVSSATNRLFHRATVGINTQYPRTDEYIMDINGPVIISKTTETNVVQNIPYEIDVLKHCRADHNYIIAVGKPYTLAGDADTFYTDSFGSTVTKNYQQKVYFTRDMGQTWSVSNFNETDIGSSPDNAIHAAYAYDASLCFVCTQLGFMYYSVDGGTDWYGIGGIPNFDNIHSVFLTDIFVDLYEVYRVFVCGNSTCTWFDMPTSYYSSPDNLYITSLNKYGSFNFPDIGCQTADGLDQIMYITVANSIYSYNIDNYDADPTLSSISWLTTTGDSYVAMSISQNSAMFVGPGLITYTNDGGTTYVNSTDPLLEQKIFNSVFLEDNVRTTALISGYDTNPDSIGAFFMYSTDQFATFNVITVENLKYFGAPPHVIESQQLYDAFLVSPESIMFFDVVQNYNPDELPPQRGESTIYNLYLPHIFTPEGSRSTSNGAAFRVDYGVAQFGDNVVMEKDVEVNGILTTAGANLADTNLDSAYLYGQTSIHDQLDLYGNISVNGILIAPIQLTYINDVTQDIQAQLDEKLGKNEDANVNGQLTFSGTNTYSGSNTFDDLRVASSGLTSVVSPSISYNITPTQLSYLRYLSSDVQTQLDDKLSLSASGSVLNGTYTFTGPINIANTAVIHVNNITLTPADFSAIYNATSNFQEQIDRISTTPGQAIQYAAMVSNVSLNTFNVPNQFNQNTTIIGNVIVYNSVATMITITPNQLSYLSSVTSNIQTQLNNHVSLNNSSGIDISGIISSAAGFTTALDVSANTVKTQYQILSGTSVVNTTTQTLTAAQSGSSVNITSATTLTLPTPTTPGLCFMIYNSSAANASIVTPAGLFVPYPDAAGITLLPDSTIQIRSNGTNWAVIGGTYDCARISSANVSVGDYATAGSISGNTNLTIAGKAAIGKSTVSTTDTLDVSGNMYVKGNSFIEGRNLTWGNLDVSGAVSISNSVSIGKTSASAGIEFDLSGDALISGTLGIGRICSAPYVADISGGIHGTSLAIDNGVIVGSTMTVAGAATFTSNVGIGKTPTSALDVSGAISATTLSASTLTLSGNPSGGYAIDCSGSIRAKTITLTDGGTMSIPPGGVADTALSTNVALLNRTPQTFTGDNNFKYISVGGALKPTSGTITYALDISGGLRITSGTVVFPDGAITPMNLPVNTCFKDGKSLFLTDPSGSTPYLGIGKSSSKTQYNVDVSGSMNADGPIYAQKLGINKTRTMTGGIETTITAGIDVDISGTASISNTLNIGKKLTVGSPSVVVASATISKRTGGAYDLFWTAATQSNLSIQLSPVFTLITLSTRKITYTAYPISGTYTFTYVFDYQVAVTNHPPITVYPNSAVANGTGYTITFPTTAIQRGTYSVTANLASGMTTGTMYVDISGVGSNLVANTQSIIVSLASTATTDSNTLTPSSATNSVPLSINGAAVFNAPTRFAGGVYADTAQTIHFGANAPIMSGSNILPGTIPSTAFATSGVDLNSNQTVSGTKTFMDDLIVSSPSRLLVGTAAVNTNRNSVITADISGGIAASKYMTVGTTTILNIVSKRDNDASFNIINTDVFGVGTSAAAVRTYSINPLNATLDVSGIIFTVPFRLSGYYTFTISYSPLVSGARFTSNLVFSDGSGTPMATLLDLSANTTASLTSYLTGGIPNNIRISAPSTVSGLPITRISLKIEYRYDNPTLDYKLAVNGDQAVFGKFVPYFGIDASSAQTINFGTNAPAMSGAGIAAATIPSTSIAGTVALLGATQTFTGINTFSGLNIGGAKLLYTGNRNLIFTGTGDTPNYNNLGNNNICLGTQAMGNATTTGTPTNNIAMGFGALFLAINTIGTIALGGSAARNMIGNYNVAIGFDALNGTTYDYTTYGGADNVAVGHSAGQLCRTGNNNTFVGAGTDFTGGPFNNSTALGFNAKITAPNQIVLGTANEKVFIPGSLRMNTSTIFLYALDNNHYLAYEAASGVGMNGPSLRGWAGGALGTTSAGIQNSLTWNNSCVSTNALPLRLFSATNNDYRIQYRSTSDTVEFMGWNGGALGTTNGGSADILAWGTTSVTVNTPLYLGTNQLSAGGVNVGVGTTAKIRYANTNTVFGNTTYAESSGTQNVCIGVETMANASTTNLVGNVGIGYQTLKNVSSSGNVGIGYQILVANTTGYDNIGIGNSALYDNVGGHDNIGFGHEALRKEISGSFNVGIGYQALYWATNSHNVGIGYQAACNTTSGTGNVAVGTNALSGNSSGSSNVAIGYDALKSNTVGTNNTCVGYNANVSSNNLSFSTAIGVSAQITTSHQIVLGTADEYVFIPGSLRMNTSPIHLYGDTYHYLKYEPTNTGMGMDGPSLRGYAGGALGTTYPAVKNVLTWNNTCVSTNQLPLRLYNATNNDYRIQYRTGNLVEIIGYNGGALGTTFNNVVTDILTWGTTSVTVNKPLNLSGTNGINVGTSKIRYANTNTVFVSTSGASYDESKGTYNVCIGVETMANASATNLVGNVGIGYQTLYNTSGRDNVGMGYQALVNNTTGNSNIGIGTKALNANTTGGSNVGIGYQSLYYNTSGGSNVGIGFQSLIDNTTGSFNVCLGYGANTGNNNLDKSTAIGCNAKTYASNQIVLGTIGEVCVIPKKLCIGINNASVTPTSTDAGGNGCLQIVCTASGLTGDGICIKQGSVNSNVFIGFRSSAGADIGHIQALNGASTSYATTSDARRKNNIVNLPSVLDKIKRIHPRSFTWIESNKKDEGFIAQEIYEVFPALNPFIHDDRVTDKLNPVDASGNTVVHGIDYGKLTTYLWGGLKETLQLVETQQSQIDAQQSQITSMQSQIDELRQMVLAMSNK